MKFLQCFTRWTHSWGWPMKDRATGNVLEHCTVCGATRPAPDEFRPKPEFAVRSAATPTEGEKPRKSVAFFLKKDATPAVE